jgi:hypothetical protein
MIGAAHSQRIDAAEQERGRAMFAALSERSATVVIIEVVLTSAK